MSENDDAKKLEENALGAEETQDNLAFSSETSGTENLVGDDYVSMDDFSEFDDPTLEPLDHDEDFTLSDDVNDDDALETGTDALLDEEFLDQDENDFEEFDQFNDFDDDAGQFDEHTLDASDGAHPSGNKLSALMQNSAVKYGAMGLGGTAAVVVLYLFVLGGGSSGISQGGGQPVAQNSATQSQGTNNVGIKQALNSNSSQDNSPVEPVSLSDNLDALPEPDMPVAAPIVTKDGEDLGDVFSILENNGPDDNNQASQSNDDMNASPNNGGTDFTISSELPMPTPIETGSVLNDGLSDLLEPPLVSNDVLPIQPATNLEQPFDIASNDDGDADIDNNASNPFDILEQSEQTMDNNATDAVVMNEVMPVTPDAQVPAVTMSPDSNSSNNFSSSTDQGSVNVDNDTLSKLNQQLTALNSRMDDMGRRMDRMESGQSQTSASSTDLSRIESAIERLEKRIESMAKQNTIVAQNEPRSTSVQKASTPAASRSVPQTSSAPKKPTLSAARSWELRGASLNNAFIAQKNGGALQTVRVGDRVAGLGTIRFIGLDKGSWVVKTSGGTIRQ